MSPEQRKERARLAATTRWSKAGAREEQSDKIANARRRRLEDKVDPGRVLSVAERSALVRSASAAEMARVRMGRVSTGRQAHASGRP